VPKSRSVAPGAPALAPDALILLAHDLKNPLAAILANLHYLLGAYPASGELGDDGAEALHDSIALCAALDRMISNLDLMARAPSLAPELEPVALAAVAHQVVARMQPQVTAATLHLTIDDGPVDLQVDSHQDLLGRALENLVANAIENAPPGSTVELLVEDDGSAGRVTVRDQGPVIPTDLRAAAVEGAGQVAFKKNRSGRSGRGCGLLTAATAATLAGAELDIGEREGWSQLGLVIPKTRS
jgi:signal transduction histidine kinase